MTVPAFIERAVRLVMDFADSLRGIEPVGLIAVHLTAPRRRPRNGSTPSKAAWRHCYWRSATRSPPGRRKYSAWCWTRSAMRSTTRTGPTTGARGG